MLQLQIEQTTGAIRTWGGTEQSSFVRKWPGAIPVLVRFTRNNVVEQLPSGAAGGIILRRKSDRLFLGEVASWTLQGQGKSAYYRMLLGLAAAPITAIFDASAATQEIEAVAEVYWTPGDGADERSITLDFTIERGQKDGTEYIPPNVPVGDDRYVLRTERGPKVVEIPYTPTINLDASLFGNSNLVVNVDVLTGDLLIENPENLVDGQVIQWRFTAVEGDHAVSFGNIFELPSLSELSFPLTVPEGARVTLIGVYDATVGIIWIVTWLY